MLTGKRAFEGEDVSDTLAAVCAERPDWTRCPPTTPALDASGCCARCLREGSQAARCRHRRRAIRDRRARSSDRPAADVAAAHRPPRRARCGSAPFLSVAAVIVASAIAGAAAWMLRPPRALAPVTRFAFALGEGQQFTTANNQSLAISPDGTRLVYVANNQLYLRSMSDLEARPIPGTRQHGRHLSARCFHLTASPSPSIRRRTRRSRRCRQRRSGGHDLSGRRHRSGDELGRRRDRLRSGAKASCASRRTAASRSCSSASRTAS